MTSSIFGPIVKPPLNAACVVVLGAIISIASVFPVSAATIGFSANIVAPTQRALMAESNEIVTFTNQVGIRFRSENKAAESIKLRLHIRDSAGQRIKPVSISGSPVIKPRKQNLITLVLPVAHQGNEVFEICLQQISKSKDILNRTCSKFNVARLD